MVFKGMGYRGIDRCNTCRKIFNQRYETLFYRRRLGDEEILKMTYLFLTGYPISNIPPLFDTTEITIRGKSNR